MKREHRILPTRSPRELHPLHRPERLALYLFLGLFLLFAALLLLSRLASVKVTGLASSQEVAARVNITNVTFFDCDVVIPEGTSLMSFACLSLSNPIEEFRENLSAPQALRALYAYRPWREGRWAAYNASLPNYTVQLGHVGNQDGLYLVMGQAARFRYSGILPYNSSISLRRGWNLVGYPSNTTRNLSESLASIESTYLLLKDLVGTEESGYYLVDTPPPGGETLNETRLYEAYWINISTGDTWVVPR